MKTAAWGIDLGTTNSCIALATAAGVAVVQIDEAPTVPSVLAWDGTEFLVGRRAANHAVVAPDQAVRSIKRHMGDADYRVRLGSEELSPIDVSARILGYLKSQAQLQTGEVVEEAVITVPAWFNEPQRRATFTAGERVGLKVTRIINEPTAAGLAYLQTAAAVTGAANLTAAERWLVYDLGGDDFDHRIVLHWVDCLRHRHNADVTQDRVAMAQLRHLAEQMKIRLSAEVEVRAQAYIESAGKRLELDEVLTRAQFAGMIEDYVESTIAKARQALEEAHVSAGDLGRALLVGGSTRIPRVQERVAQEFGIEPDAYVDVDLSVALGAAMQSALDHALSAAQIVVDIAPHALGIAAAGELDRALMMESMDEDFEDEEDAEASPYPRSFAPVIRKNARLPARFVEEFYTGIDGQRGVEVVVLQGESDDTRENTLVGIFHVPIEPRPAGSAVCVGFEYDRSGLVRVSVSEQGGTKVLKSHTLDLNRTAESNSELGSGTKRSPRPPDDHTHALQAEDAGTEFANPPQLSNFLIEQVERQLAGSSADWAPIRSALRTYRELLAAGRDAEIDDVEEQLYTWLDSIKAPGAGAGDLSAGT